ncbi:hypothetical protein [Ochrobactrum sp. BTU1]|uniref:hypothetical protein n=1 Tax=Ochrobactrum sp. BTU1 TaxID=2840456 RepID=UPI001C04A546|nr:hypothetical protein KMS41_27340 [Ochrobactrum sp. BTU1]
MARRANISNIAAPRTTSDAQCNSRSVAQHIVERSRLDVAGRLEMRLIVGDLSGFIVVRGRG